jgi:hypothetical protein
VSISPDLEVYESANQFIKLTNLVRLYQKIGWEVPDSLQWDIIDCRYRLDRVLLPGKRRVWSDIEWDNLVRLRLTQMNVAAA